MCFFGTGEVDIWVITRLNMGQKNVTFWDRKKRILGHHKMNYGIKMRSLYGIMEDDISI